ncbi:hypothetical protein V7152_15085 [Neobacillus drentensis]|uniref:hypothetical protein n=1 Tax=Neobacillus drentensis TaxID=220684 RepID=UPI002FFD632F
MKNDTINNMLTECFGATVKPLIVAGATFIDPSLAGILATALFTAEDSYRYTRAEKNIKEAIEDLNSKIEKIESQTSARNNVIIKEQLFPLFWDFVVEEQEIDKIQLFVNGIVSAVNKEEINMEKMFVYFDILKNLRLKEIQYFIDVYINKNYKVVKGDFTVNYPNELDIAYHNYVLNKLERLGMINLFIIDGNGTADENYKITNLGDEINHYFNSL